jgi:hypothetical protein
LLLAAPKPPRRTLAQKGGREGLVFEHKYPGYGQQKLVKQTLATFLQCFSIEGLMIFPFAFMKAAYLGIIETGFQVFVFNVSGYWY